jgi:23S rRNA (adenine2503-C2)-methyltransferase
MPSLAEFDLETLAAELARIGHNPAHAALILRAFYSVDRADRIQRLSIVKSLRQLLATEYGSRRAELLERRESSDGTVKMLLSFPAGGTAEAVLMPSHRDGFAAGCVSSQIGCAMGCDFCASTRGGLERSLDAAEIVEQFVHLKDEAIRSSRHLKTLVFMGMGEPMHNLDAVMDAIERIAHPDMGGLGWRQITVSTVGVVPGIDRLAEADLGVHLALSLHAPDDETRSRIVPANRRYPISEIMAAAKRFYARTRRVVNIEYCMLGGVNDSDDHAHRLARLLDGFRAHVNLIPYNPIGVGISGVEYVRPAAGRVDAFLELLRSADVNCHIRVTRGDDVSAACGQLRQRMRVIASC